MKYGWGDAIGKIFDWLPGKEESIKNKIHKIKKELDELTKTKYMLRDAVKYDGLSRQLRELEEKLANSK